MTNSIDINDLGNPQFSDAAREIFARREAIDIEYSIEGILAYSEKLLDVPLYRGEYLDHLDRFLREADRDQNLTLSGKKHLATLLADMVMQRSRMEALFERHPEINDEVIDAPIFIAGLPRSGTTNLSGILGSDTRLHALQYWQSAFPYPPQEIIDNPALKDDNYQDPGEQSFKQFLDDIRDVLPLSINMVDVDHSGIHEDLHVLHLAGLPLGYMNFAYTPEWNHWFWNEYDARDMYDVLKRTLQALQWMTGDRRRWILKNPHHLAFLKIMDETFDQASFILTHRDPTSSTVSNAYMIGYSFRNVQKLPVPAQALEVSHQMFEGMIGGLVRDIDQLDPVRVAHVYFHSYMDDVWATVKDIYAKMNLQWTEQVEAELKQFIDGHQRGRHGGKLVYHPERDFGQSREQIRAHYQFYIDKFPVQVEQSHR